jgi:peptide/nickel transport system substrate-binding protein
VYSDDAFLLTRLGVTETLVRATASGEAQPLLATSWEQITSTTWRFALRNNVLFHDGTTLDAAAVVNAINKSATAPTPPRALRGTGLVASVIDSRTVEIATVRPDPLVPFRLSSPGSAILARGAYKTAVPSALGFGTGIYQIDKYVPEQRIELTANAKHWKKTPTIAKVETRLIADPAARVAALRSGEIDLAEGIPAPQLDSIREPPLFISIPRRRHSMFSTPGKPLIWPSIAKPWQLHS